MIKPPNPTPYRDAALAGIERDKSVMDQFDLSPMKSKVKQRNIPAAQLAAEETASNLFTRLREAIKATGQVGMFLYGKPSSSVIKLLLRIYNENIMRSTYYKGTTGGEYQNIKMMIGIAEVDGDKLFITLAEDPREDPDYAKKVKLLYTFLANSNCVPEFPEINTYRVNPHALSISPGNLFPTTRIGFEHQISAADRHLRQNVWDNNKAWLITKNPESYFTELSRPMPVTFVHSVNYLLQRRTADSINGSPRYSSNSVMYPPFKRKQDLTSDKRSTGFYTCNNGSTCSESKMFSFLNDNGISFDRITGHAAFWIGYEHPPNHILSSYNYTQDNPLFQEIKSVLDPIINGVIRGNTPVKSQSDKINNFIQLFALPCPGCFSNYSSYTGDERVNVDTSDCIHNGRIGQLKRVMRHNLTVSSGGRRIKRTVRRRRRTRSTRKRINRR